MILLPEERKVFFKNWLGLLAFVNDKHHLIRNFGHPKKTAGLKQEDITKIKTKLWENVAVIDEYINSASGLSEEDIQILTGWKTNIPGHFMVVTHLKKYSVLLNDKEDVLYGVIGIRSPIADMLPLDMLPMMIQTTLMPFKGRIIYDSLFSVYNSQISPNVKKNCKASYSEIKEQKGIISTLT